jgi:PD-(D/E)XK nuclease superfamily protein
MNDMSPPPEVQSPYLPGTTIRYAWDSTCLSAFKMCPRYYQYAYIDGWTPRDESVHLRFGGEYHTSLEQYDHLRADGVPHERAIHSVVRDLLLRTVDYNPNPDTKAGRYKSRSNLLGLVIDYLDHFGDDDPAVTYVKSDGTPAVELTFKFELPWGPTAANWGEPYLLCGHLDKVVEYNGQIMVLDRKTTTTTLGEYYFKQYEPNNQMSLYTIAGQVVLKSPIKGVIIDAAQILIESPNRFVRGFTYRTGDQIEEWLTDLRVTLAQAEAYAVAGYWPMNDTSCDKYGGCRFREICSKSPQVRPNFLKADFVQLPPEERWNPLKPR